MDSRAGGVKGTITALARRPRRSPDLADAWLERGRVKVESDRPREALKDLKRALALKADPARCHYNLAVVYRARGDRAQAMQHARKALASRPGHAGARELLDSLLQDMKKATGGKDIKLDQ
jgi:tetratricopeptide (TPR) repeat protein